MQTIIGRKKFSREFIIPTNSQKPNWSSRN